MKRKITCVLLLAFAMLICQHSISQTKGVTVTGNCFLEGQTNHSGIKLLFTAVSPSAVTTEVFSTSTGAFVAGLAEGIYTVEYSKDEYLSYNLPGNASFFVNTTLVDVTLLSNAFNYFGSQSGVWETSKPCRIIGDVSVNVGDTLVIQPGVEVKFLGNYKLDVYGTLLAVGLEGDSVFFTSGQNVPAPNDWKYIKFSGSTSSGSILAFALVQYGYYGIYCENSASPIIIYSTISTNISYGINCSSSSPTIQYNTIFNKANSQGGIICQNNSSPIINNNTLSGLSSGTGLNCFSSSPKIQNNIIQYYYEGIACHYSDPIIQKNTINNNHQAGISCYSSNPTIQHNTINVNNEFGIYCNNSSSPMISNNIISQNNLSGVWIQSGSPSIFNNIIAGNQHGVWLNSAPQTLSYNLFWENTNLYEGGSVPPTFGQIVTQNANGDPCDTYFNLFMDPQFVFAGEYTFEACTNLVGDENPDNDCVTKHITGNQNLTYSIEVEYLTEKATQQGQNITDSPEAIARLAARETQGGIIEHSLGLAPVGSLKPPSYSSEKLKNSLRGETAYGNNVEGNTFYSLDVETLAATVIGSTSYAAFCGDFAPGDMTNMYIIDYNDNWLKSVDITTGVAANMVSVPCPMSPSGIWTELAINKNDGTFYATATDINASNLYTINPASGAVTLVGNMGIAAVISCTIDLSGTMYAFDIVSDNMFTIDLATGIGTLLGPAGFNGNYSQGMGYDAVNDIVYLAAYSTFAELRILDKATGATTSLGALPGETGAFGFPYQGGPQPGTDVSVQAFVSPVSVPYLGNESVTIKIKNFGTNNVSNIPVSYTLDGGSAVTGTLVGPIESGATADFTFPGTVYLGNPGQTYVLVGCTALAEDENPNNNCKTANVTNVIPTYCPASTQVEDEYIANVLCGDINNSSGWQGGVADYTAISTTIDAGASEDITITNGNAWASDIVYCWVDWNKDFTFGTGEELFMLTNVGGTGATFSGSIATPANTVNGEYRLRIRMTYSTAPVPCGDATYGEVEDYTIIVNNKFANDMCVSSIVSPSSGFGLGMAEPITIKIQNPGVNSQSNIPYEVTWIGSIQSGSYNGIYEGILNAGENVDVTLPVTVDFTPNCHLQPTSPCIDAGNPDTAYYDPDGTIADIGAFYFDQGSAAPVINDFTATPVTGRMPLVVQFSQNITGPATEYEWVFGDGSTSTLPNPVHVYNAMGYYTVSLMASGPGGSDILVKTDYIHVLAPVPPLNAAFTGKPLLGYAPLEVQFTNQSTGPWQTMLWDFGDGSTGTELNPLHVYQQPGDYSVSLTLFVTNTQKTELKENYIHAIAPQEVVAMFGVSGNIGAAPYTVAFFDQSFGSVDSLRWDFGDGTTSTLANPTHVYLLSGEYTATLTAYGPLNTSTAIETILVESVAPVILAITDRPNDQGGYVYVQFKKSFFDNVIPGKSTEGYTIQRQDNGHWVSLNSTLAYGEAVYTVEATTLYDSTAQSPGTTAFRVIAGMDEGTWISQPGEGYSVDNIAPSTPDGMDWLITGNQVEFWWNPCPDQDFRYFAVYKSDENGLFPEIPVATLTGNSFSVEVAPDEVFIYAVTAFDFAGNESLFSEEISNLDRQEIIIPQGWSGISGYLEPYNSQIENLFAPIAGNLTILMNETGMYWPGQNVNTLGTWKINRGYQIKLTQQTGYFLRGFKLTDHSLSLAAGWSLIPVLSENNADVAALFASTGLELVKEVAGFRLYWPAYGINTLGCLEPGRSYQVLMDVPGTIIFPTEPVKSIPANQPPPVNITSWNEIMPTPVSHAIAFNRVACQVFETGDIIAVFTSDGLCAGMQPYNSGTLGLVAFGDDGITADRDGFLEDEAMDFRLSRPTSGEQFNLDVTYDNNMNTGDFTENGVSVVTSVKMSPLTTGTINPDEISIFPNPSQGLFSITGIETQANIAIFNAFGLEVIHFRISLPGEIDLSGQPKGVYFLQIKTGEGVFIKKLVLN